MPNTTILPQGLDNEADDAPKKFRNIDNEDFVCTWDKIPYLVKVGEIVTKPKYLVNYMAMHLARKMYKRKMFAGKTEAEKSIGIVKFVDAEEEKKLQLQMVVDNFEKPAISTITTTQPPATIETTSITTTQPPSQEKTPEKKEEEKKPEEVSFKCNQCEFVAKNKVGLSAHKRFKHKK